MQSQFNGAFERIALCRLRWWKVTSSAPFSQRSPAAFPSQKIETDNVQEPDAAAFELRKKAQAATEPQLLHRLVELALLPSGYSDEPLEHTGLLASAARRYEVSLNPKKAEKAKIAKCAPKRKANPNHSQID